MSTPLVFEKAYSASALVYSPILGGELIVYGYAPNQFSGTVDGIEWVELEREATRPAGLILSFQQTELMIISGLTLAFTIEARAPKPRFFLRTSSATDPVQRFSALDTIDSATQIHDSARYEIGNCRLGTLEQLGIGAVRKYAFT